MTQHYGFAAAAFASFAFAGFISADFSDCPAGTHYESLTTRCISCTPGSDFTSVRNRYNKCAQCTQKCKGGKIEIAPCNVTHDTLCQCLPDYHENGDECIPRSDLETDKQAIAKLQLKVVDLDAKFRSLNENFGRIAAPEKPSDNQSDALHASTSSVRQPEADFTNINSKINTLVIILAIVGVWLIGFSAFWCIREFWYKPRQCLKNENEILLNRLYENVGVLETKLAGLLGPAPTAALNTMGWSSQVQSLKKITGNLKQRITDLQTGFQTTHAKLVADRQSPSQVNLIRYAARSEDIAQTRSIHNRSRDTTSEKALKRDSIGLERDLLLLSAASQAIQAAKKAAAASEAAEYARKAAARHRAQAEEKAGVAKKARGVAKAAEAKAAAINAAERGAAARDADAAASKAHGAAKKAAAASEAAAAAQAAAAKHAGRTKEKAAAAMKTVEAVPGVQAAAAVPHRQAAAAAVPRVHTPAADHVPLLTPDIPNEAEETFIINAVQQVAKDALEIANQAEAAAVKAAAEADKATVAKSEALQAANQATEAATAAKAHEKATADAGQAVKRAITAPAAPGIEEAHTVIRATSRAKDAQSEDTVTRALEQGSNCNACAKVRTARDEACDAAVKAKEAMEAAEAAVVKAKEASLTAKNAAEAAIGAEQLAKRQAEAASSAAKDVQANAAATDAVKAALGTAVNGAVKAAVDAAGRAAAASECAKNYAEVASNAVKDVQALLKTPQTVSYDE